MPSNLVSPKTNYKFGTFPLYRKQQGGNTSSAVELSGKDAIISHLFTWFSEHDFMSSCESCRNTTKIMFMIEHIRLLD